MSTVIVTTERLVLRELTFEDADALLEMDSDPEVQRFVGGVPAEGPRALRLRRHRGARALGLKPVEISGPETFQKPPP